MSKEFTGWAVEPYVRAMRDAVYGNPSTDKNWEGCRQHWMQPAETSWLSRALRDAPPADAAAARPNV